MKNNCNWNYYENIDDIKFKLTLKCYQLITNQIISQLFFKIKFVLGTPFVVFNLSIL